MLYVGRPVHGEANSTVGLFKVVDDGAAAVRVQVQLGRTSVNTVEIVKGLQVGDTVILSDMSAWDNYDRVQLKSTIEIVKGTFAGAGNVTLLTRDSIA